jgi:hypothetical protein
MTTRNGPRVRRMPAVLVATSLAAAVLVAAALPARAQDLQPRHYTIGLMGGFTAYDESSALRNAFYGGVEGAYWVLPQFAVGLHILGSRPTSDGSMFPMVRVPYADTAYHYLVSQQITKVEAGLQGMLRLPVGPFLLEGIGGIGRYMIDLDPQRSERPVVIEERVTGLRGTSFMVGAGAAVQVGRSGGLRLQVRDFIYTDYDRNVLDMSEPLLSAEAIPHPREHFPEPKSTIHNLRYEVGFFFRPRGGS